MLAKYGDAPGLRKKFAYIYLSLGVIYCNAREPLKGRTALAKAIRLYPWEIRHYFNLGLSFLGADTFIRVRRMKDKFSPSVRGKGLQA
jgi:hypothetical protein